MLETQKNAQGPGGDAPNKLTPLMRQFWEVKSGHPDKIILFRMGDFYEMFHDDAVTAAPILGIALTRRNKKSQDSTPMCGVPHHSIEGPINKLLKAGLKIAICDQLEDPSQAKGIVKRGVTRVLTPGMVYDPSLLAEDRPNFIAAFDRQTVAFVETSTFEAFYFEAKDLDQQNLLEALQPAEILLTSEQKKVWQAEGDCAMERFHTTDFETPLSEGALPESAQRLMSYLQTSHQAVDPFHFERRDYQKKLELPAQTLSHLEIFETYGGEKRGSYFGAINRTKTSMGARLLRRWMAFPETDLNLILSRQISIEKWRQDLRKLESFRSELVAVGDLERRLSKLFPNTCHGRDLLGIAHSLHNSLSLYDQLEPEEKGKLELDLKTVKALKALSQEILDTFVEEPPLSTKEGNMIRKGVRQDLDELIELSGGHKGKLLELERQEKESTQIPSLKVKYNGVFGYFIEVTHTHKSKVPPHYIRKQTLTQAERYTTDELIKLEEKVLSSQSRRYELETEIFQHFRQTVLSWSRDVVELAKIVSEFDVMTGLAWLSLEQNYVCPQFNQNGDIDIEQSRHPVVEQIQGRFVANNMKLKKSQGFLITGPNMAGKSTLMRQLAATQILAQMGSYVPASRANLPIMTGVYTRIGASDSMSEGLSTFMVEMKETAQMLQRAGSDSLVLLDEIGRGTATFDGMSLAQSILEYLVNELQATTFFATHYHELTNMEEQHPHIFNYHMAIRENKGRMEFLYQLESGPAQKSYGVQVAALAGIPPLVVKRAKDLLAGFEQKSRESTRSTVQLDLFSSAHTKAEDTKPMGPFNEFVEELKKIDLPHLTPFEALKMINEWQQKLS